MNEKIVNHLDHALEEGLTKAVFDHVKNFLACAFLLAVGAAEFRNHSIQLLGFLPSAYSGVGVIAISCILFALNLVDGIRELAKFKAHRALIAALVLAYVVIAVRLVEIAWNFRAGG